MAIISRLTVLPTVNWELVAWHEADKGAANEVSVFDHLDGAASDAMALEAGGVPTEIRN